MALCVCDFVDKSLFTVVFDLGKSEFFTLGCAVCAIHWRFSYGSAVLVFLAFIN